MRFLKSSLKMSASESVEFSMLEMLPPHVSVAAVMSPDLRASRAADTVSEGVGTFLPQAATDRGQKQGQKGAECLFIIFLLFQLAILQLYQISAQNARKAGRISRISPKTAGRAVKSSCLREEKQYNQGQIFRKRVADMNRSTLCRFWLLHTMGAAAGILEAAGRGELPPMYWLSGSYFPCVFCAAVILLRKRGAAVAILRDKKQRGRYLLCGMLITVNWGVYILTVASGRILEASLYLLHEPAVLRCDRGDGLQRAAQAYCSGVRGTGAHRVGYSVAVYGSVPYLAVIIGLSFALYGALKKGSSRERGYPSAWRPCLLAAGGAFYPLRAVFRPYHLRVPLRRGDGAAGPQRDRDVGAADPVRRGIGAPA